MLPELDERDNVPLPSTVPDWLMPLTSIHSPSLPLTEVAVRLMLAAPAPQSVAGVSRWVEMSSKTILPLTRDVT